MYWVTFSLELVGADCTSLSVLKQISLSQSGSKSHYCYQDIDSPVDKHPPALFTTYQLLPTFLISSIYVLNVETNYPLRPLGGLESSSGPQPGTQAMASWSAKTLFVENVQKSRSSTQVWVKCIKYNYELKTFLGNGSGEMLMVSTTWHKPRTNTFPSIVAVAGPKQPHPRCQTGSRLPGRQLGRISTLLLR